MNEGEIMRKRNVKNDYGMQKIDDKNKQILIAKYNDKINIQNTKDPEVEVIENHIKKLKKKYKWINVLKKSMWSILCLTIAGISFTNILFPNGLLAISLIIGTVAVIFPMNYIGNVLSKKAEKNKLKIAKLNTFLLMKGKKEQEYVQIKPLENTDIQEHEVVQITNLKKDKNQQQQKNYIDAIGLCVENEKKYWNYYKRHLLTKKLWNLEEEKRNIMMQYFIEEDKKRKRKK